MARQIPKRRMGNTLTIAIEVLTGGEPVSLVGRNISVAMRNPHGGGFSASSVSIDSENPHVVRLTCQGRTLDMRGVYWAIVYENRMEDGQVLFDQPVFELVEQSCMEDGLDGGLVTSEIYISGGNFAVGGRDGVGIADFEQTTESQTSLGQNVWRVTLSNGSTYDLVVRNGAQGQQGVTPQKGVDYFTDAEKAEMVEEVIEAIEIGTTVEEATETEINQICV